MEYAHKNGLDNGEYAFFFVVLNRNFFPVNTTYHDECDITWSKEANDQLGEFREAGCDVMKGVFQIMKYSFMLVQWTAGQSDYDVFESEIKEIMKDYLKCTSAFDRYPRCLFLGGKVGLSDIF